MRAAQTAWRTRVAARIAAAAPRATPPRLPRVLACVAPRAHVLPAAP
jgi:hypothetical protein